MTSPFAAARDAGRGTPATRVDGRTRTLVDHVRATLLDRPAARTYRFLVDGEGEPLTLTNAELDLRARALAVTLRQRVPTGERVLIVCPSGLDYVVAFFAALYAGVIAVPVHPPEPTLLRRTLPRLHGVIADARPAAALAPTPVISSIAGRLTDLAPALGERGWVATDGVDLAAAPSWRRPAIGGEDTAFLQYTSGSTGNAKGVVVSHENLLHNLAAIHRLFVGADGDSHAVVWLPPYHDMGLIGGLLQPAYGGFPVTLMPPTAFLKRPVRWLRAISEHGATHSGGPNFAYELCATRIREADREQLDLSGWRLAFTGAEPVRPETIDRFTAAFAGSGFRRRAFYPCYGLAEGTLIVAGGDRTSAPVVRTLDAEALTGHRATAAVTGQPTTGAGTAGQTRTLVGCGRTIPGQRLVIVDPDGRTRLADGRVGEIWVSGPSVAGGYWGRPVETGEVFAAHLADTGEGPFLRTGDLGFLDDGQLFVTGRRKDLIIIAGRNHYPQDIERSVETAHPALRAGGGVACAHEVDGAERLVIIHEIDGSPARLDADGVISAIRAVVSAEHDLRVDEIVLVRRGKVPRTSSGKLQRAACLAAHLDGALERVAGWRRPAPPDGPERAEAPERAQRPVTGPEGTAADSREIERWLSRAVAERLDVPPESLDPRAPAASYGLGSLDMVSIVGDLELWLGRELPTTLLWDHPTIEELADHLGTVAPTGATTAERRPDPAAGREPVAVIGIGCRFPGGADDPESYWKLLCEGRDAVTEVPAGRWHVADLVDEDPAAPGRTATRWGGFVDGADRFDPVFFGISPREATRMDPQQRLLAEVAWEALEDAGAATDRLAGSRTGVFVGISTNDYGHLQSRDLTRIDALTGTGNALSIAANRLSYLFDLRGPSMAIDTACSSSLVAIQQACLSLARGDCSLALAGGVNLIFSPALAVNFGKAGVMAADGRCKAFDARADGYVRSEGAGIVVLKPLRQALADQDTIYGVIRGGAVNQDGRTNGLMAPNARAQEAVLRAAYADAGLPPGQVHYVEAHGTGTMLGDPIEARALGAVLAADRDPDRPCLVGSVKSNLGHLEAAAGVAALIKVLLMVRHRMIPPSLHYQRPNPHIPFDELRLRVADTLRPWPTAAEPALVGVSSFGFGGTNAHLVVQGARPLVGTNETAPTSATGASRPAGVHGPSGPRSGDGTPAPGRDDRPYLLLISARGEEALRALAARYERLLARPDEALTPRDLCFAAAVRRRHHDHRYAVTGSSLAEFRAALAAYGQGAPEAGGSRTGRIGRRPKVAFVFAGQGPRWWPLAADLLDREPAFRAVLERCGTLLRSAVDWSLLDQVSGEPGGSRLADPAVGQPALCAVQIALAALWRSWGVVPETVVGHSVGEIAAAYVAGALSLDEALRVAVHRGRVIGAADGRGGMAVVAVSAERAERILADLRPGPVWVAASNGPTSTVLSGDPAALDIVVEALTTDGIFSRVLESVRFASHSPWMDPLLEDLRQALTGLDPRPPVVAMVSAVTGATVGGGELDAGYWAANLRRPVRFDEAITALVDAGHDTFVEIAPHPMLTDDVTERLRCQRADGAAVASLRRDEGGQWALLTALGQLYRAGFPVDWARIHGATGPMVALPPYPWQRQRYWLDDGCTDDPADDQLLYRLDWQPVPADLPAVERSEATAPGADPAGPARWTWLVLADDTGLGDQVAGELAAQAARRVRVVPGDGYRLGDGGTEACVRPGNPDDLQRLLADLALGGDEGLRVVYLWSLDGRTGTDDSAQRLLQVQQDTCLGVIGVVRALVRARGTRATELWLVTRGAVRPVASDRTPLAVTQSTLWGLGRSLQQEHNGVWGGLVDLDPVGGPGAAARLITLLSAPGGEDQIAVRDGRTYVARLVRRQPPDIPVPAQSFRADASYLITGGLGGVGMAVARFMVRAGARRLVLVGRTVLPPREHWADLPADDPIGRRVAAVRELESLGASVIPASLDVADEDRLRDFLDGFDRAGWPPIRGVVHAAGVGEVRPLLDLDPADLARHLRPKLAGAWTLHRYFTDRPVDFFVLFSSVSAILSSPFVASYAAANAFLDALAQQRHGDGLPALSINWGIWAGTGLAATRDDAILSRGMGKLEPEQAVRVLHRLLPADEAQLAVMSVDWSQWGRRYRDLTGSPLLTALLSGAAAVPTARVGGHLPSRTRLLGLPAADRLEAVTGHLLARVATTLGVDPASITSDQPLLGLGLDSVLAVELRNEVERQLDVSLPISALLDGGSVRNLAERIITDLSAEGSGRHTTDPAVDGADDRRHLPEKVFPLSETQRSIWFFDQLAPDNLAYVIPAAVRVRGRLRIDLLRSALREVVRRHDSLRTTFELRDGSPVQVVRAAVSVDPVEADLTADAPADAADLRRRIADLLTVPFDVATGPLLRVTLLHTGVDEQVLVVAMHHLISDGWSTGVLIAELSAVYQAYAAGRPSPLPELEIQYGDVVTASRQRPYQEELSRDVGYWRRHLAGAPAALALPTDRPRPATQRFRGGTVPFGLDGSVLRKLGAIATAHGATPYMALLAVFRILLQRHSGQDDVVVGVPVANRDRPGIERLIGCFVNMLPVRTDLGGDPDFARVLARVRDACLGAYAHQHVPFGTIAADLKPGRDLSRHPIFQVGFSYQSEPVPTHAMGGVELRRLPVQGAGARFDLELQAVTTADGLDGWFEYDRDLFEEETVVRMAEHLRRLVESVVAHPNAPVGELDMLGDAERRRILDMSAGPVRQWPGVGWVHEVVAERARAAPDAVAVRFAGRSFSYGELNGRANGLAHRLVEAGVGPGVLVGVCVERSVELVVALLAVWRAGGAFVPLDPGYPRGRLEHMLRDSGTRLLLTQEALVGRLPVPAGGRTWCVDGPAGSAMRTGPEPTVAVAGGDPAYVMYTSGSTGRPKGVVNTFAGIRNRLLWGQDAFGLTSDDRVLQKTPVSFDVSLWELFWPLLVGATLVVAEPGGHRDARYLVEVIQHERITVAHFVPSVLRVFLAEPGAQRCAGLRQVFCSGEALSRELRDAFFARLGTVWLHNLYGPTEAAVEVSAWRCRPDDDGPVPIGLPIANTRLFVLDRLGQVVPVGVAGELHIAGESLAVGYHDLPELTARRFVSRSVDGEPVRMFATGDLARYRPDGAIEFLGRLDRQVKLRGVRVELGEIESLLRGQDGIREALVTAREQAAGDLRLVAYLVGEARPDPVELVARLRRVLPGHMIPAAFVPLSALPLMPNGKVDEAALPAPDLGRPELPTPYEAPRDDRERVIAGLWADLLGVDRIGVHDNFFDLGGHSLLVAQLRPGLAAALDREISLWELFQYPSIAALTAYLDRRDPTSGALAGPVPVRPAGAGVVAPAPGTTGARDTAQVAVIGMAGRFPGAPDVDAFWTNLVSGRSGISFLSDTELLAAGVAPALFRQENYVRAKGVLADADRFDAGFFGYSPREAEIMDPQQRVFLECAWEALESAGCDPRTYEGRVGVFGGATHNTYVPYHLMANPDVVQAAGAYAVVLANEKDFLATRVSFKLGLKGPGITVQNACSTSLTAVHLAVRSLLNGECDIALAGGVSITMPLTGGYEYEQGGILSPDGHCRAFDADAAGTVAGNGVGIVVLRRLPDARAYGDRIAAVILGSAINNDGSLKASFTSPSADAQAEVVTRALAAARVDPTTIGYVEAHGTGTPIGDAVEIAGLTRAYREHTDRIGYCAIGSVKTSVGHLDAAAGVTSLIKAVLALRHGAIPPTLDHTRPNPELALDSSPFFVNTELRPWPRGETPRRAGVSSFGIGGTNVHVVLQEAPLGEPGGGPARQVHLLPISARTPAALAAYAVRLADHLAQHPDLDLADVAFTLARRRHHFERRQAVVCRRPGDAVTELRRLAGVGVPTPAGRDTPVVFLFPGQGAQYVGMARDLYRTEPGFAAVVDRCAELFAAHLPEDPRIPLFAADGADEASRILAQTSVTQPVLFMVEYALARLWSAWGVSPQAMVGHSVGEYVAACLAGVFSLEDAVRLVAARGRLAQSMPTGAMLAVFLPEAEVAEWLTEELCLAAVNSTTLCVVAGPAEAVDALTQRLAEAGVAFRRLRTSHAFHSPSMDGAVAPFVAEVREVTLNPPTIPFCSNVTGTWITDAEATSPEYWGRHLRATVRFADALDQLLTDEALVLLEVGPGRTLRNVVGQHRAWRERHTLVGSLRHPDEQRDDQEYLLHGLGQLWSAGAPVDWAACYADQDRRPADLPTYAFQRQRYWVTPTGGVDSRALPAGTGGAPATIDDWFHTSGWKRLPTSATASTDTTTDVVWVVLGADLALGRKLADRLAAGGVDVVRVRAGAQPRRDGDGSWSIDVASRQHHADLVEDLTARGPVAVRVVHLWSLDGNPGEHLDGTRVDRARRLGFDSLLALAQAIAGAPTPVSARIDILCRGLFSVTDDEPLQPENATALGPRTVIPQEVPDVTCRTLDVTGTDPHDPGDDAVAAVHAVLTGTTSDDDLALRGRRWWVRDHERVALGVRPDGRTVLRDGGVYLITGGLGGVGLALAEQIAGSVTAPVLGLLGRSAPSDAAEERLRRLRERGARVVLLRADVTDPTQTTRAVEELRRFGPVNGVIHAAGTPASGLIQGKTRADVDRVLAAKTLGTLVLAQACRDDDCDFILLCSSVTALLGGPGQSDYCAANAFLDAFAEWSRRRTGAPVTAVAWDTWHGVGMAADLPADGGSTEAAQRSALGALGGLHDGMTTADAVAAFARILAAPFLPGHLVVSRRDVATRQRLARSLTPSSLAREAEQLTPAGGDRHARPDLATPYVAPVTEEERAVAAIWQDVLGVDRVGLHDDLFALGGHSLTAVQIGAKIQRRFGVRLDLRKFFEASTVAAIVAALAEARAGHAVRPGDHLPHGIQVLHRDDPDDELAGLTDAEVETRLRELLAAELTEQEFGAPAPHTSTGETHDDRR